jgi:hypothetical protein
VLRVKFIERIKNLLANRRLIVILAVIGPGVIAGNAGNDAGGIATYSIIGAKEGYGLLWALVLITFALAVIQEMSSRMGVVTGKGFADMVREQFGVRVTLAVMVLFIIATSHAPSPNLRVLLPVWSFLACINISPYLSRPSWSGSSW